MSKKKIKKSSKKPSLRQKVSSFKKNHVFLFVLVCLLVIFGIYQTYRQVRIYQERKDFQSAERVVSELVDEIQAELGQTEVSEDRQCSYGTVKFDKKNLGCGFSYRMGFSVSNAKSAEMFSEDIEQIIQKSNLRLSSRGKAKKFSDNFLDTRGKNSISISYDLSDLIGCSVSYSYGDYGGPKKLYINIYCSSKNSVKTNYYPLKN